MAERTLTIPRKVGSTVVLDEYELHEDPARPGTGIARYRRSSLPSAGVGASSDGPGELGIPNDSPGRAETGPSLP